MSGGGNKQAGNVVSEEDLDEALRETFPASDPTALTPHPPHPSNPRAIQEGYSLGDHREGDSRNLDAPIVRLELAKELADLRRSQATQASGHSAKTLMKYPDLRVVLIALNGGASIGEHQTLGRIAIQTLEGRVRLRLKGEAVELPAGAMVALAPQTPYDVEAVEPSAVLLTIAWPAEQ